MNETIKRYELLEDKYKLRKKNFKKEFRLSWIKRKKAKLNLKRARSFQKKIKQEIILEKITDPNKKAKFKTKLLKTESKIATLDYKLQEVSNKIKDKTKNIEEINEKISEIEKEIIEIEQEAIPMEKEKQESDESITGDEHETIIEDV
jgi:hypothetical protein